MKPLVLIPARGGSKGVPGKNIKPLNGKPLIQYTIEAAKAVFNDDQICVSTDDIDIKNTVEQHGLPVPFRRPAALATDTATTEDVIKHAIQYYDEYLYTPDCIILLQPTSPFRTGKHIKEAMEVFTPEADMVVSVKLTKSNPYYVLFEEDDNGFLQKSKEGNFTRRQDCPKVWEYNGAIYIINRKTFMDKGLGAFNKKVKYEMDEMASIDIDDMVDWNFAEFIMNNKKTK